MNCPYCGADMEMDGWLWRCTSSDYYIVALTKNEIEKTDYAILDPPEIQRKAQHSLLLRTRKP